MNEVNGRRAIIVQRGQMAGTNGGASGQGGHGMSRWRSGRAATETDRDRRGAGRCRVSRSLPVSGLPGRPPKVVFYCDIELADDIEDRERTISLNNDKETSRIGEMSEALQPTVLADVKSCQHDGSVRYLIQVVW